MPSATGVEAAAAAEYRCVMLGTAAGSVGRGVGTIGRAVIGTDLTGVLAGNDTLAAIYSADE